MSNPNVYKDAHELIAKARDTGLTMQQIGDLCGVTLTSVYRWAEQGATAKTKAIKPLIEFLNSPRKESGMSKLGEVPLNKKLSEASLEDLAARARELGFRVSFEDMR